MNKRTRRRLTAGSLIAVTLVIVGAAAASAYHSDCPDGIDLDPRPTHITYVSTASTTTSQSVCFTANDPDPNGSCAASAQCGGITIRVGDPNPASTGRTITIETGSRPTGDRNINTTGAEAGTVTPILDPPNGGTAGADAATGGTCVYVDGSPTPTNCGSLRIAQVTVAEDDLPKHQPGSSCLGDVPGGGDCEVRSFQIEVGNDTSRNTVSASVADQSRTHNVSRDCIAGVGQACTF